MGYDIHITRRNSWSDKGEPTITREEWRTILSTDPDLESDDANDSAHMSDPTHCVVRYFWYLDGQIFVKKPNRAVLMKMLAIAEKLRARVIGDDDEVYSRDGIPNKTSQFTITNDW